MVAGTPLTLRIGFIAGFIGVGVGAVLAFTAAYYGGWVDTLIRGIADIGLTMPGLLVLIIIAVSLQGQPDGQPDGARRRLAGLAEPDAHHPLPGADAARARLCRDRAAQRHDRSGDHRPRADAEPAAVPRGDAGRRVSAAILASVGLEVLGLGPVEAPTLGMTLYWVNFNAAIINGWWWWWLAPLVVILIVFLGLFFLTVGLDEIANPRLRRSV